MYMTACSVPACNTTSPCLYCIKTGYRRAGGTLKGSNPRKDSIPVDIYPLQIDNFLPTMDNIGWLLRRLWRHRSGVVGRESGSYTGVVGGGN